MPISIQDLRAALESDPSDWEVRYALIRALLEAGQKNEARALLNAVRSLPADEDGLILAARCYALAGAPDARDILQPLLEADPDRPALRLALQQLEEEATTALLYFHSARGLDPAPGPEPSSPPPPAGGPARPTPRRLCLADARPRREVALVPLGHPAADPDSPDPSVRSPDWTSQRDAAQRKWKRRILQDKFSSLTWTVVFHLAVVFFLGFVFLRTPIVRPPEIIAVTTRTINPPTLRKQELAKPTIRSPSAEANSMPDVLTSISASPVSLSTLDFERLDDLPSFGIDFAPSASFSTMTSGQPMMFGQKMEARNIGAILDVSGSMAEYLPMVIREVDRNFAKAPIIFVNHALIQGATASTSIVPVVAEEVLPSWPREWLKGDSPYWFLWGDLPRKAPQRYVDRLINTFRSRPNLYLARGGSNRIGAAAEFLCGSKNKLDGIYIFSDFADYVEKETCDALGKSIDRAKVRTYVQPAELRTEYLDIVTQELAGRTGGRALPPLTELLRARSGPPSAPLAATPAPVPKPDGVEFATPRQERDGKEIFLYRPNDPRFQEHTVVSNAAYDLVLCAPEARALLYIKTPGGYIQHPVLFGYSSYKPYLDEVDGRRKTRRRLFLRHEEEPKLVDNEFRWKMILEDEIRFEVIFWFRGDTATATYVAEHPPNGEGDGAHIHFTVPPLAWERQDRYYSSDFPGGLELDALRVAMTGNHATIVLPVQAEDRFGTSWNQLGFKKGNNVCPYNKMFRTLPDGVREVFIAGPSFGPRQLEARTTSNNLLLNTGTRADMELWEGFNCSLTRPGDRRERETKTEAIAFTIK
jgi:hypothetical protein